MRGIRQKLDKKKKSFFTVRTVMPCEEVALKGCAGSILGAFQAWPNMVLPNAI